MGKTLDLKPVAKKAATAGAAGGVTLAGVLMFVQANYVPRSEHEQVVRRLEATVEKLAETRERLAVVNAAAMGWVNTQREKYE